MSEEENLSWTSLQRRDGSDFLRWVRQDGRGLRPGLVALSTALGRLLDDYVRTREDALETWAAVPAVVRSCNDPETYCLPHSESAYAWLHLLDRYVRTWLALEQLLERCPLPMGSQGVRALDVGTGPGLSAFATHGFFTAMVAYGRESGDDRWHQPPDVTCVEPSTSMNHFRHLLAEYLSMQGAPSSVLARCGHISDFGSLHPRDERKALYERLRDEDDEDYYEHLDEWHSTPCYTPEEAIHMASTHHRYRLFTFSNFLTEPRDMHHYRANLIDVLSDAHPGSVLFVLGATSGHYPRIYSEVAALAREVRFLRKVEGLSVSSSHVELNELVHREQVRFYRELQRLAGKLPVDDCCQADLVAELEGERTPRVPTSSVHAYRK